LVGTVFFTLRTAMMLIGGDVDADVDVGVDVEFDAADADMAAEGSDSTAAFKVLSIQAIAAFLMGFGWGGLGAFSGSGWSPTVSVLVALVAGLAMMWVLGALLRFVYGMQSTGNVPMYQALEAEGRVYAQIPPAGAGKGEVRVVIGDRERYYKATSDGAALPTGARVRVVSVNEDDNSVTVTGA
jgi:membrane protein implicated in regulation of membrane protease activity